MKNFAAILLMFASLVCAARADECAVVRTVAPKTLFAKIFEVVHNDIADAQLEMTLAMAAAFAGYPDFDGLSDTAAAVVKVGRAQKNASVCAAFEVAENSKIDRILRANFKTKRGGKKLFVRFAEDFAEFSDADFAAPKHLAEADTDIAPITEYLDALELDEVREIKKFSRARIVADIESTRILLRITAFDTAAPSEKSVSQTPAQTRKLEMLGAGTEMAVRRNAAEKFLSAEISIPRKSAKAAYQKLAK